MFGYVTICKEQLSEEGFDTFRAYYCGLCHEIGRRCSQAARLGLSYDITFLAVTLSSLYGAGETKKLRCFAKPWKARLCAENDEAVQYAADMGVLLAYLKCRDDWQDEHSLKSLLKMLLLGGGAKKAGRRHGNTSEEIRKHLSHLAELEAEKCASLDETADCFAKILETLFAPDFIGDKGQRRALAWLGYNIGRWIYIIDAFCDMEKDIKEKNYNPFICANEGKTVREIKTTVRETLAESLTFTLENAASAYNLLEIKRNRELMENILFTALKAKQNAILGETDESL